MPGTNIETYVRQSTSSLVDINLSLKILTGLEFVFFPHYSTYTIPCETYFLHRCRRTLHNSHDSCTGEENKISCLGVSFIQCYLMSMAPVQRFVVNLLGGGAG